MIHNWRTLDPFWNMQEYVNYFQIEFGTGLTWENKVSFENTLPVTCLLMTSVLCGCQGTVVRYPCSDPERLKRCSRWNLRYMTRGSSGFVRPSGSPELQECLSSKNKSSSRSLINCHSNNKAKASPLILLLDPSFNPIHSCVLTSALTLPFPLSADVLLNVSLLSHLKRQSLLTPRTSHYKL